MELLRRKPASVTFESRVMRWTSATVTVEPLSSRPVEKVYPVAGMEIPDGAVATYLLPSHTGIHPDCAPGDVMEERRVEWSDGGKVSGFPSSPLQRAVEAKSEFFINGGTARRCRHEGRSRRGSPRRRFRSTG